MKGVGKESKGRERKKGRRPDISNVDEHYLGYRSGWRMIESEIDHKEEGIVQKRRGNLFWSFGKRGSWF